MKDEDKSRLVEFHCGVYETPNAEPVTCEPMGHTRNFLMDRHQERCKKVQEAVRRSKPIDIQE